MAASAVPKLEKESLLRGDSRTWTDTYLLDDGTGTPFDFTTDGWDDWLCQIRADLNRGTLLATVDVDASQSAAGIIIRKLAADQSDLLPGVEDGVKPIVYMDIQATRTSDGFRQTFRRWKVTIEGDTSND